MRDNQSMAALLLNVQKKTRVCRTNVPRSNGAQLAWAGFSDTGLPAIVDSDEVLRALIPGWHTQLSVWHVCGARGCVFVLSCSVWFNHWSP